VSGGFAHGCYVTELWGATIKNAALNAVHMSLAKEYEGSAVRINTLCVHFGVTRPGGDKNQLGFPSSITSNQLGAAFTKVASNKQKGQLICLSNAADIDAVPAQ
jgi:hypothetical protein